MHDNLPLLPESTREYMKKRKAFSFNNNGLPFPWAEDITKIFSFRTSLDPKRILKFYSGKRYGRQLDKKMSLKLQSKIPFQKAEDMKKIYFFRRNLNPNRILFLVPAIHTEENILNFPIYY
jgi:hypothetical protein